MDFWATWCPPCVRLKKETLQDPKVSRLLNGVELIFVDLDKHPDLGKAFGVHAVPDVFLIDGQGVVVDRLRNFEPPNLFLARLKKFLGK